MELDLWLGDRLVAQTESRDRGRKVRIVYDETVRTSYPPETPLLSCSLPTPGPSEPAKARAFLEGLLPEGRALQAAAAQVRGVRLVEGAPETPADAVALLAEIGRDCAGAIVVVPRGESTPSRGRHDPLSSDELDDNIRNLPQHPLGINLSRGIRRSLGGAQPKTLLARINGQWCEPIDGAPSTHILKPTRDWPDSAHNEALVLALGRHCDLGTTAAWVEEIGGTTVLVAERYDRRFEPDGRIIRLHQEDMCQAIGLRPKEKYGIGRPSGRMSALLREFADSPRVEVAKLFRQVAFRSVVGDEDGHGKNYSLLLDDDHVRLAPLYDSLCTLEYPELSGRMAAPIGRQETLANVDLEALVEEARAMGLTEAEAREDVASLIASLRSGLDSLDDNLTRGWPSEQLIDVVRSRVDRLETGEPLGGTKSPGRAAVSRCG
jgi:serine/threonine-protein kinase HipA